MQKTTTLYNNDASELKTSAKTNKFSLR